MATQRKPFRIEAFDRRAPGEPCVADADAAARHEETIGELKALRALLQAHAPDHRDAPLLRAQFEELRALKDEMKIVYAAIQRTREELATIHLGSFQDAEVTRATGELGAVIGGTELATQAILEAAEAIDESAATLVAALKAHHELNLAQDIQDRVIRIYEACNFQDIAGQRITKAMATMRFVEEHVTRMMEIWGGLESLAPALSGAAVPAPDGSRMVSGPRLADEPGHASQDEIDVLFGWTAAAE